MTTALPMHDEMSLVLKALAFASLKHSNQRRKDEEASPYINHPIALASILWNEAGVREADVIVAALLHDTVEDTETSFEELEAEFGLKVAGIVREVTDDKSQPKAIRKQGQIQHAAHASPQAQLVKLADKISNLRDLAKSPPPSWSHDRIVEYFDWAHAVIAQVRGVHPALEALFDEAYRAKPQRSS